MLNIIDFISRAHKLNPSWESHMYVKIGNKLYPIQDFYYSEPDSRKIILDTKIEDFKN